MKLIRALEIGEEYGLETIEEAVWHILDEYDVDIFGSVIVDLREWQSHKDWHFDRKSKIADVLKWFDIRFGRKE